MYKTLFLCLILGLSTTHVLSQTSGKDRKQVAFEALDDLKEGVLLLRLKSYNRQKEFLNKRYAERESPEAKAAYQERLEELEAKQTKWNRALSEAVKDIYNYSTVYYVYDTSMYALQEGKYEGRVFTTEGTAVDAEQLAQQDLFVLSRITNDSERAITTEGLSIWRLNDPSQPIAPFPYFSKLRYRLFSPMTAEIVTIAHRRAMRRWMKSLQRLEEAAQRE